MKSELVVVGQVPDCLLGQAVSHQVPSDLGWDVPRQGQVQLEHCAGLGRMGLT